MTTLDGKGQQRHGTTAEWADADPVLLDGEIGWDDTLKLAKKGDGSTQWSSLAFLFDSWGTAATLSDAAQAAAEATADAALSAHDSETTSVHGVSDMALLLDTGAIGVTVADVSHNHTVTQTRTFSVAGELAVGTGVMEWPITRTETLTKCVARLGDESYPAGADLKINVLISSLTVFSPLSNQLTITAGTGTDTATPDVTAMVDGDYLSINIDQIGSTTPGSNLIVVIESTYTI